MSTALLSDPSSEFTSELRDQLQECPLDTQLRWIEVLRRRSISTGNQADMGLCLAADSFECQSCGMQVHSAESMASGTPLAAYADRQTRGLRTGDALEACLQATFTPLLLASDRVVVLDGYLVPDAVRGGAQSGLVRFLELADSCGVQSVLLYTGLGSQMRGRRLSTSDMVNRGRDAIRSASLRAGFSCELIVVDERTRRSAMHDRFLGFEWTGERINIALGKGLGQYNGRSSNQGHSVALQDRSLIDDAVAACQGRVAIRARLR